MKRISTIISFFLAAIVLFSCNGYDDSKIDKSITNIENSLAALEHKADSLNGVLSSVSGFINSNYISRVGTDKDGNYVITYQDKGGEKKTVTLAKASSVSSNKMFGTAEEGGVAYWRFTSDNGKTWEWLLDKDGNKMPLSGPAPVVGINSDGYWTVNGENTGVLAKDMTTEIFSNVEADSKSGLVVFTLTDGSSFSVTFNEALSLAFSTPSFLAVEDYGSTLSIGYTLGGSLAKDATVDYLTAYNVKVSVSEPLKTISVSMDEGAEEGNVVIVATAGDEIVYKPLFFSYGKTVIELEDYIKDNEVITPMGEPVVKLTGDMTAFTIRVAHNIDVEASVASECSSWLKRLFTKGTVTSEFNFVAEYFESKTNDAREGRILLKNALYDVSTAIVVKQTPIVKGGGSDDPSAEKGIGDVSTFMEFVRSVNAGASTSRWENEDGEVCLLADLDLTGVDWTPAGSATSESTGAPSLTFGNAFVGKFNGQGHCLSGIAWSADISKTSVYGLFGAAKDAEIKNLVLGASGDAITVTGTPKVTPSIGCLIGYAENVTISNVTNNVDIIYDAECPQAMATSLAGIVGSGKNLVIGGKTKDEAVKNNGDILVRAQIANAQAGGTGLQTAGITAYVLSGTESSFTNCSNTGHITGPNGRSGGIIASINGTGVNKTTISKCVNSGLIEDNYLDLDGYTNAKRMGGILGGSEAQSVSVESCTNSGNVFSHTGCRCGGFVGHFKAGAIAGCANTGIILSKITPQAEDHSGGDGPGWAAGYCNIKISGCTRGGKVGEWETYKNAPESAPDATVYNAYGYRNSQYFDASDNQ